MLHESLPSLYPKLELTGFERNFLTTIFNLFEKIERKIKKSEKFALEARVDFLSRTNV
jgi:hypothetical protein